MNIEEQWLTIEEWFNKLKEPYKSKAIYNCKNYCNGKDLKVLQPNIKKAIMNGFGWINTPEGHFFWAKVFNNPPIEKKSKTIKQIVYDVF